MREPAAARPVGVTIGTLGSSWRATVSPWGSVRPCEPGSAPLDWWIAADDRWHDPATEVAMRQRRLEGTPVVETVLRVPGGDAVHRAWAVATAGGLLVVEVENRSSLPFAVALSRRDLLTSRPPTKVPVHGITLPADAIVLPVAHGSSVRVALAQSGSAAAARPDGLPSAEDVARGWLAQTERGPRIVVPSDGLAEAVIAARCALLLDGPPDPVDDPEAYLLAVGAVVEAGGSAASWVDEVAVVAARLGRSHRKAAGLGWDTSQALIVARGVLLAAGERAGAADVDVMLARLPEAGAPPVLDPVTLSGPRLLAVATAAVLRVDRGGTIDLLPGFEPGWLGQPVEAHDVPTGDGRRVGVALRWHGARPAILWEVTGPTRPLTLTTRALDPTWTTTAAKGEALLALPPIRRTD